MNINQENQVNKLGILVRQQQELESKVSNLGNQIKNIEKKKESILKNLKIQKVSKTEIEELLATRAIAITDILKDYNLDSQN